MKLSARARAVIESRRDWLASASSMVIDADVHLTDLGQVPSPVAERMAASPDYFHGKPLGEAQLLRDLELAGVDAALCWQNPATTTYVEGDIQANWDVLERANRFIAEAAARHPRKILPAGWTDPRALGEDGACALVDRCVGEFGFPIVKMNPAQNRYPIDSPPVLRVVDRIVAWGAVPAFHFGADTPFTPADGLERVASRHPNSMVIGVHMGGGGAGFLEAEPLYHAARQLGLTRTNIFYVFSAKRECHMESDLIAYEAAGEPWCRHLACASDAPYGLIPWHFAGFRALFRSLRAPHHPDARIARNPQMFEERAERRYLGGNIAAVIASADRRLLSRHSNATE